MKPKTFFEIMMDEVLDKQRIQVELLNSGMDEEKTRRIVWGDKIVDDMDKLRMENDIQKVRDQMKEDERSIKKMNLSKIQRL